VFADAGASFRLAWLTLYGAEVELVAGDLVTAERELRWAEQVLERMQERAGRSTVAALLAKVLADQGRDDEAEHYTVLSEETTSPHDVISSVTWRGTRARLLARRGELGEGETLAREAVRLAMQTDGLNMRANALLDLAEVLLAGDAASARRVLEQAIECYEAKGNLVAGARAKELLAATPA
jgi:ATP/maltotriose-dependent transcriptional regulator MalT